MVSIKNNSQPKLVCKDFTVSGESFEIHRAKDIDLLLTHPVPDATELPNYYKSDKYISHTDGSSTPVEKIYQRVKNFMLRKKLEWIEAETNYKNEILDIGAGTGDFLLAAKKRGWKISGVEPNSLARKLAEEKGLELVEDTSFLSASFFDVITMWHVLEHVPDLDSQINELTRLLKPDGLLVIAVPNFKSYDAQVYKEHWAAYDVPRHLYHFSPSSLKLIFERKGFKLMNQKGLLFDAFYVSLLSEKYKTGSHNFLRALKNGFISNLKSKTTGNYSSVAYFLRKREN